MHMIDCIMSSIGGQHACVPCGGSRMQFYRALHLVRGLVLPLLQPHLAAHAACWCLCWSFGQGTAVLLVLLVQAAEVAATHLRMLHSSGVCCCHACPSDKEHVWTLAADCLSLGLQPSPARYLCTVRWLLGRISQCACAGHDAVEVIACCFLVGICNIRDLDGS